MTSSAERDVNSTRMDHDQGAEIGGKASPTGSVDEVTLNNEENDDNDDDTLTEVKKNGENTTPETSVGAESCSDNTAGLKSDKTGHGDASVSMATNQDSANVGDDREEPMDTQEQVLLLGVLCHKKMSITKPGYLEIYRKI